MPTIKDLRNKKPSANIKTYTMRSITALFSSLYWIFVLKDLVFIIVINLELLACVIIFILKLKLIYTQQYSNKRFSKNKKTIS